jgi:hypothetical protein
MDILDEEILNLWRLLNIHSVKYIIVGGFATNLHGFNRITADLNIWIKDDSENRKKLRQVLKELELGDFPAIETIDFIPGWSSIMLSSGFELDIMTSLKGFPNDTFEECYKISPTAIIYNIPIKFMNLNKLIEAKKAVSREKDLIDIIELEKIKKSKPE